MNLVVADSLPTSNDSKIKIIPIEPSPAALEAGTTAEEAARPGGFDDNAVGEVSSECDGAGDVRSTAFRDTVAKNPVTSSVVWSKRVAPSASAVITVCIRIFHLLVSLRVMDLVFGIVVT